MSNNAKRLSQTPASSVTTSFYDNNASFKIPQTTSLVWSAKGLSDSMSITKSKVSSLSRPTMMSNLLAVDKSLIIILLVLSVKTVVGAKESSSKTIVLSSFYKTLLSMLS